MIGAYRVRVKNSRNAYDFVLRRNITLLLGNSGTGKTTLYDMLQEYNRLGKSSGVVVSCDKSVIALDDHNWEMELDRITDSIIVIDEDRRFVRSRDFAEKVNRSDNYFLLITRDYLPQLPYSVDEIYELTGNKNKRFKNAFEGTDRMFDKASMSKLPFKPDVLITEDGRSGYQFFKKATGGTDIVCESAEGKSNIYSLIRKFRDKKTVVIADGAAFGSEIRQIVEQQKLSAGMLAIFLPESFEWLILKSGLVKGAEALIEAPVVDSQKYLSWEQYFTDALMELTKESRFQKYSKEKLPDYYTQEQSIAAVKENMKGLAI